MLPVAVVMKGVTLTVRNIANRVCQFVSGWKATLRLAIFHPDEYEALKNVKIEDHGLVEVGPPECPCNGPKYFLMFGEEICEMCHEWTGRMKGIDC